MNCSRVQDLVSAYYDDELPTALRQDVAEHMQDCQTCAKELAQFKQLSGLASQLGGPEAPEGLWGRIETEISHRNEISGAPHVPWWNQPAPRFLALAASLLIVIGFGVWISVESRRSGGGNHVVVDLAPYATQFYRDPIAAQRQLLAQYAYRDLTPDEVRKEVAYEPVIADSLPGGFVREELRLVEMPCCTCVQAVYRSGEAKSLATFQQSSDESFSFEGCNEMNCQCCGIDTRLAEVEGGVAASWPMSGSHLTLVGAHDMRQVVATMQSLIDASSAKPE